MELVLLAVVTVSVGVLLLVLVVVLANMLLPAMNKGVTTRLLKQFGSWFLFILLNFLLKPLVKFEFSFTIFFSLVGFGIHRTTFLIDEKGRVEKVISKVKTKDHAAQILEDI